MRPRRARPRLFAALSVALVVVGCTQQTSDDFKDPPQGPPSTCALVDTLPGCVGQSFAYSCTSLRPDDGDLSLVCSVGAPGAPGTTLYCCAAYGQYYSDCAPDPTIPGCNANSFGFSCGGETSPDEADALIACNTGALQEDGTSQFCCTSTVPSDTCARDADVACSGVSIGYSCTGGDPPNTGDPSTACSVGQRGSDGSESHCCLPFAQDPTSCQADASGGGCGRGSYSFTCAAGHDPKEIQPLLRCSALSPGEYCCDLR